jgi:hypothetical protein
MVDGLHLAETSSASEPSISSQAHALVEKSYTLSRFDHRHLLGMIRFHIYFCCAFLDSLKIDW